MADRPVPTEPTGPGSVPARVTVTGARAAVAAGWSGGLLGTKIVPPTIPGGFLRRQRLQDGLDAAVTGPVTAVSAGAGSGKTLVVADWARAVAAAQVAGAPRVAWLALDRDDNEPTPSDEVGG